LTELNLSSNQISDITPLQSCAGLIGLGLSDNQISDLTPLQSCAGLTGLSLSDNQISDLTPLQSCAGLRYLDLNNNQISDLTPLQSLTGLANLDVNFAPQQKTLIEAYHHSWETLGNSTASISRTQATIAVKNLYEILGLEVPEITFCTSPNGGVAQLNILKTSIDNELMDRLRERVKNALHPFSLTSWWRELEGLFVGWDRQLNAQLFGDLYCYEDCLLYGIATTTYVVEDFALAEFCVSGLGIVLEPESQKLFEAVKQLLTECGWIFPLDGICIVCDRPIKLLLDREYRLHAEGESAIEFADGYKLYSYHGVTLPKKYGAIHPHNWQAKWILSENNAEIRRVLIQRIGYDRICQELQAIQLDSWQEYSLLKIDNADIEPIHLLKMNCQSTGFIHALRVPPNVRSSSRASLTAQEAIRWVNWDIDPAEFSVQT
jgi:internalin A